MQPNTPHPHAPCPKLEEVEPAEAAAGRAGEPREGINMGRTWNQQELYSLAAFFFYNAHKFSSQNAKKRWKVYKLMSAFVQTRNINQCRSYTHKLLRSFGSIHNINAFFQDSLPRYHAALQQLRSRNLTLYPHPDPDASPTRASPEKTRESGEEEVKKEEGESGYVGHEEGCLGRAVDNNVMSERGETLEKRVYMVGWTWTFPQLSFFQYMLA